MITWDVIYTSDSLFTRKYYGLELWIQEGAEQDFETRTCSYGRGAQILDARIPLRLNYIHWCLIYVGPHYGVALGGLVVSVLATGPKVRGFDPEVDVFLRVIKIRNTTSFGGEVKPSVPCRRFTACKRTLRAWIEMFRNKFSGHFSPKSPGSGSHIRIESNLCGQWAGHSLHHRTWP
jgi:hypothetical protein